MQIILMQIFAVIVDVFIAFSNNKIHILIATFIHNAACMLLYFILRDYSTVASYILIVSRSFVYLFQDKLKIFKWTFVIPIIFIICHILTGLHTMTSMWHILPIIAPCIVCFLLWFEKKRQRMRLEQATSDALWLTYNLHCGLYILCISRIISIISGIAAFIKNKNKSN